MLFVNNCSRGATMVFLLALPTMLLLARAEALVLESSMYPSVIQLTAGTFHAPPMMTVEQDEETGNVTFGGLQADLVDRLKEYAAADGVDLQMELLPSPDQYDRSFDLIANDCNTTDNPHPLEDCQKYDLIVNDYWSNPQRYMRADFSPAWMRSTVTTVKYVDKPPGTVDFTTLADAEQAGATICVPVGTYLATLVRERFPGANYRECHAEVGDCVEQLRNNDCVLYAHDELLLYYNALSDPSLEVTRESFNTQYIAWPFRGDLPPAVSRLLTKWIFRAVQLAALDELYFKYYKRERCPHGTAGNDCELPCDPDHGRADDRGK